MSCWSGDDYELAAAATAAATRLGEQLGDPDVDLIARSLHSTTLLWTDPATSRALARAVLADNATVANDIAALAASVALSILALLGDDGQEGLRRSGDILRLQGRLGVRNIADTLETRGNHYMHAGRAADAVRCYGAAHQQNIRIGRSWPRHPGTGKLLASAQGMLSASGFAQDWSSGERLGASNLVLDWL